MDIAEDMLLDVRRQMVADAAGLLAVPALSHFPSVDACDVYGEGTSEHDRLALCRLLPFVEYWAVGRGRFLLLQVLLGPAVKRRRSWLRGC